jgi:diguanylate cyclase (GGDEF)-like protein/PAS domain S-box-containing protein
VIERRLLTDPADAEFVHALAEWGRAVLEQRGGPLEASVRAIMRRLPLNLFAVGEDGRFTMSFGGALDRLGLRDDEVVGLPAAIFGPQAEHHLERALQGEAALLEVRGRTGTEPWVFEVFVVPLPGHGIVAMVVDVTGRWRAEEVAAECARVAEEAVAGLRSSEERFRLLATNVPVGIFQVDEDGRFTFANPALAEIIGRSVEEVVGREWLSLMHPEDLDEATRLAADGPVPGRPVVFEHRALRPDGTVRWVRSRAGVLLDGEGNPTGAVGSSVDITDALEAAAQLREREERTRAILESAAEGIITLDGEGVIVEFNAAAERIFGYDSTEAIGMSGPDLVAEDRRAGLRRAFEERLREDPGRPAGFREETLARRKDGTLVPVEVTVAPVPTSHGTLYTAVVHDISERRAFELELEHQATHDALTGLPNRALLMAELEAALARAGRHRRSVGVLFVQLDRLKLVTDTLGHRAGDELVVETARRLGEVVGDAGTIARFGGDQFVVFCDELDDVSEAVEYATRILEVIDQPYRVGNEEAFLTASIGIAFAVLGLSTAETMISNADVAMFRAKERGARRFEIFDAEMRAWIDARRKLEIALRHGIDRGEFELFFQPIVALEDRRVVGFEALARWNHPVLGLLPPSEFIPVAEESGLIVPLGDLLLEQACRHLANWQRTHPDLFVSVNLAGPQLARAELVEDVQAVLGRVGAEPRGLHLEITETVLLRDLEAAVRRLQGLHEAGVRLCLDDFGTGYSSLTYLSRFPIDILKVDRSFVARLGSATRDASMVTLIVGMAHSLQLGVIAEGVETETHVHALVDLACPMAQGYLFAKPMPAASVEELL